MKTVNRPDLDMEETFKTCTSRARRVAREALRGILQDVVEASTDYVARGERSELHLIQRHSEINGVSGEEMQKTYTSRMVQKGSPGRPIYDTIKLLPENDQCPLCAHRDVSTLDHILPKEHYPIFAVTPVNLVGCCKDCNHTKRNIVPTNESDLVLHPYFDNVTAHQWLTATVQEQIPPAVIFRVQSVPELNPSLNDRIKNQFNILGLADLYSRQAAGEISDIRHNMQRHFDSGGVEAVRDELEYQWQSRRANNINSWKTATYEALKSSDWYCEEGFALI